MVKKIIWFTGLSGSGKTTIANLLNLYLRKLNFKVKIIDGDIFRNKTKNFKFTRNSIVENNLKIIDFVKKIYFQYDFIIVSAISPLVATRSSAKKIFKKKYYEILVECNLKTLQQRDVKGLYKKARAGIINNLIGYNSRIKYEKSKYKVITVNTKKKKKKECLQYILHKLKIKN
jgi:adenylylsulfate kinase-like enzyme